MKNLKITIKQSVNSPLFKDVYVNGICMGTTMADDTMTGNDCYQELLNSWDIDRLEFQMDEQINRQSTY